MAIVSTSAGSFRRLLEAERKRRDEGPWKAPWHDMMEPVPTVTARTKPERPAPRTLRKWLKKASDEGASHVVVCIDSAMIADPYPVFVWPQHDARQVVHEACLNFKTVLAVFNLDLPFDVQIKMYPEFNY